MWISDDARRNVSARDIDERCATGACGMSPYHLNVYCSLAHSPVTNFLAVGVDASCTAKNH